MTDRISDLTIEPFVMIPETAFIIAQQDGTAAFCVYANLKRRLNRKTGALFPSLSMQMKDLNLARHTIVDALTKLQTHDVIMARKSFGRSTHYVINDPSDWAYETSAKTAPPELINSTSAKTAPPLVQKLHSNHMNKPDELLFNSNELNKCENKSENDESATMNSSLNKGTSVKQKNADTPSPPKRKGRPPGSKNKTHDEQVEVGPHGKPLNRQFEVFKAYCECIGDDPYDTAGLGIRMKPMTKDFYAAIEPHEVKSLYDYVFQEKNKLSLQLGKPTFKPSIVNLKQYYARWRQREQKRAALAQKMSEEKPITTQTVEVDVEAQLALIAAQRKRFESIVHETIDDVL